MAGYRQTITRCEQEHGSSLSSYAGSVRNSSSGTDFYSQAHSMNGDDDTLTLDAPAQPRTPRVYTSFSAAAAAASRSSLNKRGSQPTRPSMPPRHPPCAAHRPFRRLACLRQPSAICQHQPTAALRPDLLRLRQAVGSVASMSRQPISIHPAHSLAPSHGYQPTLHQCQGSSVATRSRSANGAGEAILAAEEEEDRLTAYCTVQQR